MHQATYRRRAIVNALAMALFSPLGVYAQSAAAPPDNTHNQQDSSAQTTSAAQAASGKKAANLEKVVVTGSRIARAEVEGPTPVTVITGDDIKKQGFTTVYELMNTLTQTGVTETPASWGSTSTNARQVDLRNMGSGRSLLLIDGHRVVDYPQPAKGKTNFQNYNNIPTGMIDRIEILASGASSIYGSDAIAGVVNVILKKNYSGDDIKVQVGTATRGGRNFGDFNFVGGKSGDHWQLVYNLERSHRTPLWGRDRPYTDSDGDAGYGAWDQNARLFGYRKNVGLSLNDINGNYLTPPAGACSKAGFGGSFSQYHQKTVATNGNAIDPSQIQDNGSYCAQNAIFNNWTLTPGRDDRDAYVAGSYDFGNGLQAYGSVGFWDTTGTSNTQLPFLYPYGAGGVPSAFYDQTTGQVISGYYRQLTAGEMGGYGNTHDKEQNWDIHTGLRGTVWDGRFNWDLNLGHSKYIVRETYTGLNELGMFNFFFGPQQGTTNVGGTSYPVYAMNTNRFWNPITPQQYQSFGVVGQNNAVSWMDQASLNVTGDLFNTWAGPVGFAGVMEANHEGYRLSPDARGNDASFSDPFQDSNAGGGTRMRYSLGTEFRIPLSSTLTATLSGRLDKYNDASSANVARTWGGTIEWRPLNGLLLRGSYGTNFHAPDMQYIYKQPSQQTVGIYSDYYQCISGNQSTCNAVQHPSSYTLHATGGRNLLPETGHSWTYGFVWDLPWVEGLSVSADYWHMGIDNAIDNIDQDAVLKDEAGCRTGLVVGGAPYLDHPLGSDYCRLVTSDVKRNASGTVTDVYIQPVNQNKLYVSGIDTSVSYHFKTQNWGAFNVAIEATNNRLYQLQKLATDPLTNTRHDRVISKLRGTVNWRQGPWDVTLYGDRAGEVRSPHYGGCEVLPNGITPALGDPQCVVYTGHNPPWITYSTTIGYRFNDTLKLGLVVSNIFNKVGSIPYYAGGFEFISTLQGANYTGREISMRFEYKID
ncbi:TonB-dependent receptor plug domain-containing protein [Dyella silvatica]|uniref:TonB-dependent receptor plug domain-containing protein n=1 Tax=Dyella silvatica TaxID=2992128 RepID=UPI002258A7D8|nr:TonB-dependent receptor [Dyella silvatica]